MQRHLEQARDSLLEWLRTEKGDPSFLTGETILPDRHGEIVERFLGWAKKGGFDFQIVQIGNDEHTVYEVHWTHRGASFVGFKQPPPESTDSDALLAGCAALLDNQWCRDWLMK